MTDRYADLRAGLESLRQATGELRGPEAQVAALLADYDRMRSMLAAVVDQLDDRRASKSGDDAPGHSHDVPGVWDSDNGELAGKPCAWCALWREAKALAQEQGGSDASL